MVADSITTDNVLVGETSPNVYTNYSNVGELLLEKMRCAGESVAQFDGLTDTEDTFAELLDRVLKCALWLKKQGVRRGDVVAIATHNHINTVVPCIAATCIGAIFNPWDSEMNLQLARHFATLSQPKVIFINESKARVAQDAFKIEGLQTKLVVFDEDANATTFSDILKGLWTYEGRIPLWFSNFYWISGTLLSLNCIVTMSKRIIFPFFDEKRTCELIEKYNISWLFLSSSMTNRWVKSGYPAQYEMPSLECILTGGAVLKREMQAQLQRSLPNVEILQGYGMTELGGVGTRQKRDSPCGSCGVVATNVQLKIIEPETGRSLGANQTGELLFKAPTMTIGYYRNPEVTRETIDKDGWIHTGDLGYYDEAGELFIVDRMKELIKYRGRHISPGVIENVLHTHPGVIEAAVVGLPHLTDDEHPVAFVRLLPDSSVTAEELISLVAKNLMDHERLRGGVQFIEKFPETATGKISRKEVRAMAKALVGND